MRYLILSLGFLYVNLVRCQSAFRYNVYIDYKSVTICEETPGVESFSGHIHLPPATLEEVGLDQPYSMKIHFWYFQNREIKENAPLTVILGGGLGASTLMLLFRENGPCKVNADSSTTRLNKWSWNSESDMLYLDQSVQTGFSYDHLEEGTQSAFGEVLLDMNSESAKSESTPGSRRGFFSSNDPKQTANSTQSVAQSTWLYLQIWLRMFDRRQSSNPTINIWSASYGGHYAPSLVKYTLEQNERLESGELSSDRYLKLHIGSVGLTNACVDVPVQLPYHAEMARANTYNLSLITQADHDSVQQHLTKPDGCLEKIATCRAAAPAQADDFGQNATANTICHEANSYCGKHIASMISTSGISAFDIGYPDNVLHTPLMDTYFGYLNQRHIQEALHVPLNFSANSRVVAQAFSMSGDNVKGGSLEAIGSILDSGISVTLIYGDRDFACNWLGGKALSQAVQWSKAQTFRTAGIQDLVIPLYPKAAQVQQGGGLSFIHVHSAGHSVGMQQPQIAQTIFNRAIAGLDIATGSIVADARYATFHEYRSWEWEDEPPPVAESNPCYILNLGLCSERQQHIFLDGLGTVQDFFLIADGRGACIANPVRPCVGNKEPSTWDSRVQVGWKEQSSGFPLLVSATALGYVSCVGIVGVLCLKGRKHRYSRL
ncbi:Peptidase S10 serine carboxypeptidase [Penicillium cf. griseofulvum]|uniref:Peptidase S10 serine carboxypeptidase n=1 Tax=Penicillium cf. griseofulvum TaxID=2972120 RepID=A0A9W9LYH0_9EURO|nr:Peptidase S10 serine carboxypeptidase [Penicillium cf. griseofulvum]KAJ5443042.1 Peptidase S10 serine carboxypeptidase [Penicillium cf. griseofulvum]KAJ5451697.1 Peptidase S10 serine carboxypeptidase [Penicillium cf. griseofulvum]